MTPHLVLVEIGRLRDESGVGVSGAGPEGGHPIQQGTDLKWKGDVTKRDENANRTMTEKLPWLLVAAG